MPKKFLTALAGDAPEPKVTAYMGNVSSGKLRPAKAPALRTRTLADFFTQWSDTAKSRGVLELSLKKDDYQHFKRRKALCAIFGTFKTADSTGHFARKDENLAAKSVLVLDFDDITESYSAWDALCQKIGFELGYKAYITPSLRWGDAPRVHIWIPLDEPLTDPKAYKAAVLGFTQAFKALGVVRSVDKSSGTWSQAESLPVLTQLALPDFEKRPLFQVIGEGKPILSTKKLLKATHLEEVLSTEPKDAAKTAQARGLLHADLKDGTSPAAIVARWADAHKDWVADYPHFLAAFFQVGYAEHVEGTIEHEQALECMRALACGRADWAEENIKKYEQESNIRAFKGLELGHQKGLAFFYGKKQVSAVTWLTFSEKGVPHIDYEALAKDFAQENKLFVDAIYPTGGALFDKKTRAWIERGWSTALERRLSDKLFAAGVWSLQTLTTAKKALTTLAVDPGKEGRRPLDHEDPWLVAFANGKTWDPRTGDVWDTTAEDCIPNTVVIKPSDDVLAGSAEPRAVLAWLEDLFGGDLIAVDFFCRFVGYTALREQKTAQCILFLTGSGANGKSTLLRYVSSLFGDSNIASETVETLTKNRFASADLWHKLLDVAPDITGKYIEDPTMLKAYTGGDSVRAEFKGQTPFSFVPYAKLLFSANRLPQVSDVDGGLLRRLHVITCPLELKGQTLIDFAKKHPMAALKKEKALFLAYCVKAFVSQAEEDPTRLFKDSRKMKASLDAWITADDPLKSFFEGYCQYDPQSAGDASLTLYRAYVLVSEQEKTKPVKSSRFKARLCEHFATDIKKARGADGTGRMRAVGVTLTEDFFDTVDEWRRFMTDRDSADVQALLDTTEGYIEWTQEQAGTDTRTATTTPTLGMQDDIPF